MRHREAVKAELNRNKLRLNLAFRLVQYNQNTRSAEPILFQLQFRWRVISLK